MDDIKQNWMKEGHTENPGLLDKASLMKIVKNRSNKQINISMKYFWASFVLQILVYALLSHVIIRYWEDTSVVLVSLLCILLYVPFTVVLMRKFKRIAILKCNDRYASGLPMNDYINKLHALLASFYKFKKIYEIILIPLSSAIMIWIIFKLYVPGGVMAYPIAAILVFLLTIGSCLAAILAENKRNFKGPIKQLEEILKDLENGT